MAFPSINSLSLKTALVLTTVLFSQISTAGNCTANQRKAWSSLTDTEKKAYIDAELCLQSLPATLSLPNTQTVFDEFQWAHLAQVSYIHSVGAFLPWHRYFVTTHERALQEQCNYTGAQPYWDELADQASWPNLTVFDPDTGFGGNGLNGNGCITDGPFVNLTLHLAVNGSAEDYCLSRAFNRTSFENGAQERLDVCYTGAESANFSVAWPCYENHPHSAGHGGVRGVMVNVGQSPGDPLFYLHHTYLDMRWWQWQQLDLSVRLTQISGTNVAPSIANVTQLFSQSAFVPYNGDPGNVTTLNHTLWVAGIKPNITIADVMDITDDTDGNGVPGATDATEFKRGAVVGQVPNGGKGVGEGFGAMT